MNEKGFEVQVNSDETPNLGIIADKPLKTDNPQNKRVDINVLKARAKAIQDKENIKNTFIFILFLVALGTTGIYFSI